MTGTGNDIIALSAINSTRTKQLKFYSKILSPSELTLYTEPDLAAIPFENFVWLLWSVKESAFKYLKRNNPELIFSPTKFVVLQVQIPLGYSITNFETAETEGIGFDSEAKHLIKGMIKVGAATLYSRSMINKEMIVSVVNEDENFEETYWGFKLINKSDIIHQSMKVREFLVNRLSSVLYIDDLMICKGLHGFPVVIEAGEELAIPVSLSHHDHLLAYSFQTEDFQNNGQL